MHELSYAMRRSRHVAPKILGAMKILAAYRARIIIFNLKMTV